MTIGDATALLPVVAAVLVGYLLGALPFAVWIGRIHEVDPRQAGERNPGATNVYMLAGRRAGVAVGVLDAGKGLASALAGLALAGWAGAAAGAVGAMVGHAWPWWSRFRGGGRSVAVLVGSAPVLGPLPALLSTLVFGAFAAVVPLRWAASAGLLAFPPLFALLEPDRRRLVAVGVAYLILLTRARRRLGSR